jgi:hypothetical protein
MSDGWRSSDDVISFSWLREGELYQYLSEVLTPCSEGKFDSFQ